VLTFGLLVNPLAGVGGSVALKGSDDVYQQALERGAHPWAPDRTRRALKAAGESLRRCRWLTWGGAMGETYLRELGLECEVLGSPPPTSTARDMREAVRALVGRGLDLLVFAGGDGTARDILQSIDPEVPVLGIPAGVKMHSGVFATTPESAGELLSRLTGGGLVQSVAREVRDLDEAALRAGTLRPHFYGELKVPEPGGYLQHTKERGRENEALAVEEIAAEVVERVGQSDAAVVLGPGTTVARIKELLGVEPTLLGFDVWRDGRQIGSDVDASWLEANVVDPIVVLSFTRNQGFLLGRGNQQLTPSLLRRVKRSNLWIVGTRTKLKSLEGRPLLVDTDDPALDRELTGLIEIITGYEDRLWYRLDHHA